MAEEIVTEAYEDLGKDEVESLTVEDFVLLCSGSGVADYFVPL